MDEGREYWSLRPTFSAIAYSRSTWLTIKPMFFLSLYGLLLLLHDVFCESPMNAKIIASVLVLPLVSREEYIMCNIQNLPITIWPIAEQQGTEDHNATFRHDGFIKIPEQC